MNKYVVVASTATILVSSALALAQPYPDFGTTFRGTINVPPLPPIVHQVPVQQLTPPPSNYPYHHESSEEHRHLWRGWERWRDSDHRRGTIPWSSNRHSPLEDQRYSKQRGWGHRGDGEMGHVYDERLIEEARHALEEARRESQPSSSGQIATRVPSQNMPAKPQAGMALNPEMQMAVECVTASKGNPKAAAVCTAGRLTQAELDKCKKGIGTAGGCFGPNNDVRKFVENGIKDLSQGPGDNNDLFGKNGAAAKILGAPLPNILPKIELPSIKLPW